MSKRETKVYSEHHKDGSLSHSETWEFLSDSEAPFFNHRTCWETGRKFIRVGKAVNYHANGKLKFEIQYDTMGNFVTGSLISFREDGTRIEY